MLSTTFNCFQFAIAPRPYGPETVECNEHACPVNCHGGWAPWSECTAACGGGQQRREFQVLVEPQHGGGVCLHQAGEKDVQMCNKAGVLQV